MVEAQFKASLHYLADHTEWIRPHIPIAPLCGIVKDYYCSELLFENELFAISGQYTDNIPALAALISSAAKDYPAVTKWRQPYAEHRLEQLLSLVPNIPCNRPRCWYARVENNRYV